MWYACMDNQSVYSASCMRLSGAKVHGGEECLRHQFFLLRTGQGRPRVVFFIPHAGQYDVLVLQGLFSFEMFGDKSRVACRTNIGQTSSEAVI
jgi:hypothetical protein